MTSYPERVITSFHGSPDMLKVRVKDKLVCVEQVWPDETRVLLIEQEQVGVLCTHLRDAAAAITGGDRSPADRLTALAPELLAFVRETAMWLDMSSCGDKGEGAHLKATARALLARAEEA